MRDIRFQAINEEYLIDPAKMTALAKTSSKIAIARGNYAVLAKYRDEVNKKQFHSSYNETLIANLIILIIRGLLNPGRLLGSCLELV